MSHDGTQRLWVSNLPSKITEYAVIKLFSPYGKIKDFFFPVHKAGQLAGASLGYCFVTFEKEEDAMKAIACLNGMKYKDKLLTVKIAKDNDDKVEYTDDQPIDSSSTKLVTNVQQSEPVFMCHFKDRANEISESKKQQYANEAIKKIEKALKKIEESGLKRSQDTLVSSERNEGVSTNIYLQRINQINGAGKQRRKLNQTRLYKKR